MNNIDFDDEKKPIDNVNHPAHYERDGGMQCIDEMLMIFGKEEVMAFCKLNAWKYRYRAADKNGIEDIRKSDWYMNKYKELKEKLDAEGSSSRACRSGNWYYPLASDNDTDS